MQIERDEEARLVKRSLNGDEAAFTTLYRLRHTAVYRFALHMSGSTTIAEDVTQETFFTLLRDGRSFDPARGPLQSFLAGIARNHVLKALAKNRPQESDVLLDDYPAGDDGALTELLRRESLDAIRDAVLRLPPQYREVVVFCDLEEMDYAAASAVLNVPVGTVRSRLSRGRRLLLNRLTKEENKEARTKSVRCLS